MERVLTCMDIDSSRINFEITGKHWMHNGRYSFDDEHRVDFASLIIMTKLSLKKILFHLSPPLPLELIHFIRNKPHNESPTFVIRYRARPKRRLFEIVSFVPVVSRCSGLRNSSNAVIELPSFVAGSVRNGGNVDRADER